MIEQDKVLKGPLHLVSDMGIITNEPTENYVIAVTGVEARM